MNVVDLPKASPESLEALDQIVSKLNERYAAGSIRALCVITVDVKGEWFQAHFNSTLSDESYMIQLIQARLTRRLNE